MEGCGASVDPNRKEGQGRGSLRAACVGNQPLRGFKAGSTRRRVEGAGSLLSVADRKPPGERRLRARSRKHTFRHTVDEILGMTSTKKPSGFPWFRRSDFATLLSGIDPTCTLI